MQRAAASNLLCISDESVYGKLGEARVWLRSVISTSNRFLISAPGRSCCRNRKSNNPKNLTKVEVSPDAGVRDLIGKGRHAGPAVVTPGAVALVTAISEMSTAPSDALTTPAMLPLRMHCGL
jgi:hypothetical protein